MHWSASSTSKQAELATICMKQWIAWVGKQYAESEKQKRPQQQYPEGLDALVQIFLKTLLPKSATFVKFRGSRLTAT